MITVLDSKLPCWIILPLFDSKLFLYLIFSAPGGELPCEFYTDDEAFYKKLSSTSSASDNKFFCHNIYLSPIEEPLQPHVWPLGIGPSFAKTLLSA